MSVGRLLVLSLLMVVLTGCVIRDDYDDTNAPYVPPQSLAPAPAPAPLETAGGRVVVRSGQTLYGVAREANVPVRALIDANALQPPYILKTGQSLTIPHLRQHIMQPGETLYAVARQHGVEASSLARENHLNPPYTIKSGTTLILPAPVEAAVPVPAPVTSAPAQTVPAAPASVSIAPPPPPSGGGGAITITTLPPPAPLQPPLQPPADAPLVRPPAKPAPAAPPPQTESEAKPSAAVAALVANHTDPVQPLFLWPVRGRILSVFGTGADGAHNDGINIAAPEGTTVSAAESGTVAYAGNELRGFGNLLLIKHEDGWVTAYAHNQVLLVKKGQKIRRGEAVARVGTSGGIGQAQLHFELRRGTKAIDPLDHLPQLAGAAG
jgi:murein DD-endopeptidase MepM/ murein hydrolase activator NlpD